MEKRICLVTAAHLSGNPRMVKEADTLAAAGFTVDVVALDVAPRLRELDRAIRQRAAWRIRLVTRGSLFSYALRTLLQRLGRFLLGTFGVGGRRMASAAHHRLTGKLAKAARETRADLYIAHNLAALPAAAWAARKTSALLGFDAEDFHTEELTLEQRNAGDQRARALIEQEFLPQCSHLAASAPLIARAYADRYRVAMQPILNVFPLSQAPEVPTPLEQTLRRSMYWFSQTIGPFRGLEEILGCFGQMREPITLYLRGNVANGYDRELERIASQLGMAGHLRFLAPADPDELPRLASPYQLGLAVEPGSSPNNSMALSNKIFTYLLAGIPVLLSRTPAQEQLAKELGDAALLIDLARPAETAGQIEAFLQDADLQASARACAWRLARERYNWDVEGMKFLQQVRDALA